MEAKKGLIGSQNEAARILGLDPARLRWAKRAGCPGFVGQRVDIAAVKKWLEERGEKMGVATGSAGAEVEDKTALECRKLRLQCEQIEENNQRERDGHLSVAKHHEIIERMVNDFQTAIYDLTPVLPPDLAGLSLPEIEKRLKSSFDAVFEKIKKVST